MNMYSAIKQKQHNNTHPPKLSKNKQKKQQEFLNFKGEKIKTNTDPYTNMIVSNNITQLMKIKQRRQKSSSTNKNHRNGPEPKQKNQTNEQNSQFGIKSRIEAVIENTISNQVSPQDINISLSQINKKTPYSQYNRNPLSTARNNSQSERRRQLIKEKIKDRVKCQINDLLKRNGYSAITDKHTNDTNYDGSKRTSKTPKRNICYRPQINDCKERSLVRNYEDFIKFQMEGCNHWTPQKFSQYMEKKYNWSNSNSPVTQKGNYQSENFKLNSYNNNELKNFQQTDHTPIRRRNSKSIVVAQLPFGSRKIKSSLEHRSSKNHNMEQDRKKATIPSKLLNPNYYSYKRSLSTDIRIKNYDSSRKKASDLNIKTKTNMRQRSNLQKNKDQLDIKPWAINNFGEDQDYFL